jgi:hypothetical protein
MFSPEYRSIPNSSKLRKDSPGEALPDLSQVCRHAAVTPDRSLYLESNLLEQEGADIVKSYMCITSELPQKRRS